MSNTLQPTGMQDSSFRKTLMILLELYAELKAEDRIFRKGAHHAETCHGDCCSNGKSLTPVASAIIGALIKLSGFTGCVTSCQSLRELEQQIHRVLKDFGIEHTSYESPLMEAVHGREA